MKTYFAALGIIFLTAGNISAISDEQMKFRHITAEDGLCSNTVHCIFQDSEGQMWFGTNDGLVRYDTYSLNTYRNNPREEQSIGNNSIYCISEDNHGNLWIGTEQGVFIFDRAQDRFTHNESLSVFKTMHIKTIAHDPSGRIWISTLGDGIQCLDKSSGKIRHYRHNPSDSGSIASDYSPKILCDALGNIWSLASGNKLYRFDEKENRFIPITIKDAHTGQEITDAYSMCLDWEENIWIGGWDSGIFHYDKEDGTFRNYLRSGNEAALKGRIHTIYETSPGKLLIGSDEGLTFFNVDSGLYETSSYMSGNGTSLSDDFVHDILVDREGGLWVATYFGGVNYASPNSRNFSHKQCKEGSSRGRIVSKFHEASDTDKIWIGTDDGGLFLYDIETESTVPVIIDNRNRDLNIHAILQDSDELWIGTYGNGLYRKNLKTGNVQHYTEFGDKNSTVPSVYSLYKEDSTDRIYIGTKTGLFSWSEENGFTSIMYLGYNSDVIEICADTKGKVWFASISKGLFMYDPVTGQSAQFNKDAYDTTIPNEIQSMSIIMDQIFIGTSGKGLIAYDIATGRSSRITSSSIDMQDMTIKHIINCHNDLWLTTNEGLVRYNISTKRTNIYGKADGLKSDIFNCNSGILASDGKIYIGTTDGFNVFNPEAITRNDKSPITILDRPSGKVSNGDKLLLRKGNSTFSFRFASMSFMSPHRNRFRYIMENFDDTWHEAAYNENTVTYKDLPTGKYVFRVCSCNNDGVWGDTVSATIDVKPYWWNCTAAMVIYIILSIAIVASVILLLITFNVQKKRNRIEKMQHAKEKVRIETELQFFTNLAHEIRTPVMLINAPANEIMSMEKLPQKVKDNIQLIQKSSNKLLTLTKELLEFRKCSSDMTMRSEYISLLTKAITEDFRSTAYVEGIELQFVDNTNGNIATKINADAWEKVMSNLLTNALKFTDNLIEVKITQESGNMLVSVHDNGAGIEADNINNIFLAFWHSDKNAKRAANGFGIGLTITRMLLHNMGMRISVNSQPEKYSTFTISIPLEQIESEDNVLTPPQQLPELQKTDTEDEPWQKHSAKLMIIINDDDLRLYFESVLSDIYLTFSAKSEKEAFDDLQSGKIPDIIVCDVVLPQMDGIDFCRQLRNNVNFCHIPVILLAAETDVEFHSKCLVSGADACLDKPVDITHLIKQINNLLRKRRIMWDTFSKRPLNAISGIIDKDNDGTFMKEFCDMILENLSRQDLTIDILAEEMHMSRSVLYRRVKEASGETPNNFIKTMRMRRAMELMASGKYKINEVCWMVGFNTPSYFSKCFNQEFGINPTEFISRNRHDISDEKEGL